MLLFAFQGNAPTFSGVRDVEYSYKAMRSRTLNIGISVLEIESSTSTEGRYIGIQNHSAVPIFCLKDGASSTAQSLVTSTPNFEVGFRIAPTSTNSQGSFWQDTSGYAGALHCTAPANTTATIMVAPGLTR